MPESYLETLKFKVRIYSVALNYGMEVYESVEKFATLQTKILQIKKNEQLRIIKRKENTSIFTCLRIDFPSSP